MQMLHKTPTLARSALGQDFLSKVIKPVMDKSPGLPSYCFIGPQASSHLQQGQVSDTSGLQRQLMLSW